MRYTRNLKQDERWHSDLSRENTHPVGLSLDATGSMDLVALFGNGTQQRASKRVWPLGTN